MKIIKKLIMIAPLMLSFMPMAPISSCSIANSTKPTSVSRIAEEDCNEPITVEEETSYVTHLTVTNEQELNGLVVGNRAKIQIDVCPSSAANKKLEYESSNPEIATVEDGYVIAKSKGRAKIEIWAKNRFPVHRIITSFYVNVFDEGCKLSFADDRNGRVTKPFVNVEVGSTFTDIIKNYDIPCIPNEGYQFDNWVDQNNNLINFDTPITSDTTIKATFKIQEEQRYVTGLKVENKNELLGVKIGSKTKIQMGITPEDATDKSLEFESSNPDVAVVEDGCVVAKSNGHTEITVHANISCLQHSISTFFYVNVYSEGCKITFTTDGNGEPTQTSVIAQVGSSLADIVHNYDISCVPIGAYKFNDWIDENNNSIHYKEPITSDKTIKVTFKKITFENDSWENIISIADYYNQGFDIDIHKIYGVDTLIGLEKNVVINHQIHKARVIDEWHDTCADTGKKAMLTFQLTTLLSDENGNAILTEWDTGNNYNYTHGYLKGNLTGNGGKRSWNTTAYDMLPIDLRKGIKKVNKTIWEWNSDGKDGHYVDYSDYLFALTCTEYAQTDLEKEYHTEGTPYKYWAEHKQGNHKRLYGDDNCVLTRTFNDVNGNEHDYWLASPHTLYRGEAWSACGVGHIMEQFILCDDAVSFGFCI